MKQNVVTGLVIAWVSFLSGWGGVRLFAQTDPPERIWSSQPFVANVTQRYYASPADKRPQVRKVTYARRTDRSYFQKSWGQAPDGSPSFVVYIVDTARNEYLTVESLTKSVIRTYYSSAEFDREFMNRDTESCSGVPTTSRAAKYAPLRRVPGLEHRRLVYLKITEGNGKGLRIDSEKWLLREFECFPAKSIDTFNGNARTEWEIDSLVPGDPDPSHFTIPEGYEERSYMAMELAYKRMFQGQGFFGDRTAQDLESRYWLHRTPQARGSRAK